MKIGDLVSYKNELWHNWIGIVIRERPGTSEYKFYTVKWVKPKEMITINPKNEMEVISG